MADSLLFDGTDDKINFSAGGLSAVTAAVSHTLVAIVKKTSNGTWDAIVNLHATAGGTGTQKLGMGGDNSNNLEEIYNAGGLIVDSDTIDLLAADNWVLVAVNKTSGLNPPRFHKYVYDTAGWTHDDAPSNGANTGAAIGGSGVITVGEFEDTDSFVGNILIVGVWTSVLSDGTIETLITGLDAWTAAAPQAYWRLNSLSSLTDLSGGGANETARVGTTLDTGDAPAGWLDVGWPPAGTDNANEKLRVVQSNLRLA